MREIFISHVKSDNLVALILLMVITWNAISVLSVDLIISLKSIFLSSGIYIYDTSFEYLNSEWFRCVMWNFCERNVSLIWYVSITLIARNTRPTKTEQGDLLGSWQTKPCEGRDDDLLRLMSSLRWKFTSLSTNWNSIRILQLERNFVLARFPLQQSQKLLHQSFGNEVRKK